MTQSDEKNSPQDDRQDSRSEDASDGDLGRLSRLEVPPSSAYPPPPQVHFQRPMLGPSRSASDASSPGSSTPGSEGDSRSGEPEPYAAAWGRGLAASMLLASSILVSLWIGQWLDQRFHSTPWLTLIMTLLGIAAGFINLFRLLSATRPSKK